MESLAELLDFGRSPLFSLFLFDGDGDDIVAAAIGVGFGIYSFFMGFKHLRNKRLIENTPTSKCRSVPMGMTEVAGKAAGDSTAPSLIGQIPSYCSRVEIERYQKSGKNSSWKKVHTENFGIPFFVEDDTGRVKVDPDGADFHLELDCSLETGGGIALGSLFGGRKQETLPAADLGGRFRAFCSSRGVSFGAKMRFQEHNLCPGNPVYVLGVATEQPGAREEQQRVIIQKSKLHPWFCIAEASQKDLLGKMNQKTWLHVFGGGALSVVALAWLLYRLGML